MSATHNYKQRSLAKRRSKSRKGIFCRKKVDTSNSTDDDIARAERMQVTSSESAGLITAAPSVTDSLLGESRAPISGTSTESEVQNHQAFKVLRNKTEEKLNNTPFTEIENSPSKRQKTRSTTAKLGLNKTQKGSKPATGYKLVDFELLQSQLSSFAVCGQCKKKDTIEILTDNNKNPYGLAEQFVLSCRVCDFTQNCYTSKKAVQNGHKSSYDVNIRSVLASQAMGRTQLGHFCATMDLPQPVTSNAYISIQKKLLEKADVQAEKIMNDAAHRLFEITRKHNPENISNSEEHGELANVAVTVDGTWQRRGHSSKHGVVFVLSVETGEVLDYSVKRVTCQTCTAHMNDDKNSSEYDAWKKQHESNCYINHEGSAGTMEGEGAIEIFSRSIEKRRLIYDIYVGDGDTGSFSGVKRACAEKYGELYNVTKEDCVGHIQKRMGSGLREYKRKKKGIILADGKSAGGNGRLTDLLIDKIQNNYGEAIRKNVGNLEKMSDAIWAIYHHRIIDSSRPLAGQHSLCPRKDWCKYWNSPRTYNKHDGRLPEVFLY